MMNDMGGLGGAGQARAQWDSGLIGCLGLIRSPNSLHGQRAEDMVVLYAGKVTLRKLGIL